MVVMVLLAATPGPGAAQPWVSLVSDTRYLALGDSLSAGYGAVPTTRGFTYRLYQQRVIDRLGDTIFVNAAMPGARSQDVLDYQVPQVPRFFMDTGQPYGKVVTLTVGGNDLLTLLGPVPPDPIAVAAVLQALGGNLSAILLGLLTQSPDVRIFIGNLYDPRLPVPGSDQLILAANQVIGQVVGAFPPDQVRLVDLHRAFQGRSGLLLSERPGADPLEVHPSHAGYRAMAEAFADAISQ